MATCRKWKNALFNLAMIALIAFTIWAFVVSSPTKARPSYAKDLPSSLKNYCIVCHTAASGGPLNVFGDDYLSLGLNINATANLDSDGDGFTNEEELAASTFPGDPNSYPGSPTASMPILEIIVLVAALLSIVLVVFVYRRKMKEKRVGPNFTKH
ncbi:MAG: thrombospondin type 3 repeat-containing protein [Candidatus Heimdallarchaeota archaeon]